MAQKIVEVAAAVIERSDEAFLLAQRPAGKVYEGFWEFPGGKIEQGEEPADALKRELLEELGILVELAYPWITQLYSYQHATVRLHFHRVVRWRGDPQPREKQMLSWQHARHLTVSPVLPANVPVFKALSLPTRLGITCAFESGIDAALTHLRQALSRGLRLVQVRETLLQPAVRADFAAHVVALVRGVGGITLINSDAQLAAKLGAGVHLPSQQLMAAKSRPDAVWCSASCHNAAELAQAHELGLDFVLLGPVQPTPSHPVTTEMGWKAFANLIRDYPLPVFALGGMRLAALHQARCLGAHGLAMVRGAWEQQTS